MIALKDEVPRKAELKDEQVKSGSTYIGVVNGLVGKAGQVSVRFFDGVSRSMKVKDLNVTKDYQKVYKPGKVIRVAVNKLERLCTKQLVIEACLSQANKSAQNELMSQVGAFAQQYHQSLEQAAPLKVGEQVEAEVQLIKDYGLIVALKLDSDVKTGFILNDHKLSQKYKPGQKLTC